ncbi:MAG TPA: hypothetical protein VHQ48_14425 [Bradyrhizobium sp.]|nr:hypothetical protein [Bradyrhizobium sp.]
MAGTMGKEPAFNPHTAQYGGAMNQRELSFFYRGILLLILGGFAIRLLSSIEQPWAYYSGNIAVVFLFVAGAAFTIFVSVRQFRQFLNAPLPDEPLPEGLYLDRWHRAAGIAVLASVLLSAVLVAVLLFVEPPRQCPNWHYADRRSTSLWLPFLVLTVPLLAALVFMVIRWKWFVQKAIESTDYPTTMPVTYTLIVTVLFGCGLSQFPWALLAAHCWWGP